MSLESIIAQIDSEIVNLRQVKALLTEGGALKKSPGRPRLNVTATITPDKPKRRKLSAAARAKIAAAQKARWAKTKAAKA